MMDQGQEFAAKVTAMLKDKYGIEKKLITIYNPQANIIVERVHQTIHNMICAFFRFKIREIWIHSGNLKESYEQCKEASAMLLHTPCSEPFCCN
eukprot:3627945-Ditylum_brightwellii.AAC.1